MVYNIKSNGLELTDLLFKIIRWRRSLPDFFTELTNLKARGFQLDFFDAIQNFDTKSIVIFAGRGIGKTMSMAVVALWYTFVLSVSEGRPMKVVILAGSFDQSKICYGYVIELINKIPFLQRSLATEPTQREVKFKDGSWIRPMPASEKTVRGHHPDLLIIDEAAQVENELISAALPMTISSPYARHIFASTPRGTQSWVEEIWDHQDKYKTPRWRFFNWSTESILSEEEIKQIKETTSLDKFMMEYQGLPYKQEGKVFKLADLKLGEVPSLSQDTESNLLYAGIDWGYCLTGDTELLTRFGWKRMDEFKGDMEILTWNSKQDILEYQKPTKYDVSPFTTRECECWKSKNLSILGTWHHALPVKDRHGNLHEHELKDNLSHHSLIRRAKFVGKLPEKILDFDSKDFMKLFGWYLSEGSYEFSSKEYRISIAQLKSENREKIKNLLCKMHLNPREFNNGIRFSPGKKLTEYFFMLGNSYYKHIPIDIKMLDSSLLKEMSTTMMLGDGDKDGIRYNTCSKQLAEDFMEITLKIGKQIPYIEKRSNGKGFRVHLLSHDTFPNKKQHSIQDYSGRFVAIEVPNGYVMTRHDGKPVIIHNFPAPTVLTITQRVDKTWRILFAKPYLGGNYEEMHKDIKAICTSYKVLRVYTDSTDKGENMRLSAEGLPVVPITFKGSKPEMIANLRMLIEQHKLQFDPLTQQPLVSQLLDYVYESKRNDDYVDSLMLAVRSNPMIKTSEGSFEDILKEMVGKRTPWGRPLRNNNSEINSTLKDIGRM